MHYGPAFGALELIGALHFLWGPQSLERGFSKAGLLLTVVGVGPVRGGGEGGVENLGRKTGDQSSRPRCLTHWLRYIGRSLTEPFWTSFPFTENEGG